MHVYLSPPSVCVIENIKRLMNVNQFRKGLMILEAKVVLYTELAGKAPHRQVIIMDREITLGSLDRPASE